jgi:hypothetical protein
MSHWDEVVTSPRTSITATSELTIAGCHLTHLASDLGRACQKVPLYGTFVSGLSHPAKKKKKKNVVVLDGCQRLNFRHNKQPKTLGHGGGGKE